MSSTNDVTPIRPHLPPGDAIAPPATLGMLGGGQLGRMFTIAARTMGYRVTVFDPDPVSPAGALANLHLQADYLDERALDAMAGDCAAVSTEFENVPEAALRRLAPHCAVRPGADAVRPTQDRLAEKGFLDAHDLPTVAWAPVRDDGDLDGAVERVGAPAILKRAQGGYDGKGQARIAAPADARAAFDDLGGAACILEARAELACEVSVIVCRGADGSTACYPPGENVHVDGILSTTRVPVSIDAATADRATAIAADVAAALDYCGVLGVELFVTTGGAVLVNELAPRPHNSGHYTLDASATDQFEQQVRLLCGLPPGSTGLLAPVAMVNLLGDCWADGEPDWTRVFAHPGAKLHLYGKREPRPGRKMGHVNVIDADAETALAAARRMDEALSRRRG